MQHRNHVLTLLESAKHLKNLGKGEKSNSHRPHEALMMIKKRVESVSKVQGIENFSGMERSDDFEKKTTMRRP
ncbi:hypothetical protein AXF42_Ash011625 [Apostasia shenzhenica]|uniref:Uncharacterized protein n=1 Tax=Apostasia shenzhenica TaxID=1088818 RepID=A0A2I0BB50_9ASPA|nr:hypothetical protein AXF42_Ash011625 [Apostasia shenzhenica]